MCFARDADTLFAARTGKPLTGFAFRQTQNVFD
jgi:hypothetical protein